jgi:hypothetical protein
LSYSSYGGYFKFCHSWIFLNAWCMVGCVRSISVHNRLLTFIWCCNLCIHLFRVLVLDFNLQSNGIADTCLNLWCKRGGSRYISWTWLTTCFRSNSRCSCILLPCMLQFRHVHIVWVRSKVWCSIIRDQLGGQADKTQYFDMNPERKLSHPMIFWWVVALCTCVDSSPELWYRLAYGTLSMSDKWISRVDTMDIGVEFRICLLRKPSRVLEHSRIVVSNWHWKTCKNNSLHFENHRQIGEGARFWRYKNSIIGIHLWISLAYVARLCAGNDCRTRCMSVPNTFTILCDDMLWRRWMYWRRSSYVNDVWMLVVKFLVILCGTGKDAVTAHFSAGRTAASE